jgi:CRISPR system Cascade subunit CasE
VYLSKVQLSWEYAKNPYELHKALWKLFPERPDESRGFLFRVENIVKYQSAQLLMQSVDRPSSDANKSLLACREIPLQLYEGQLLRFRLRANPIKTIKDADKGVVEKKGKIFTRTVRVPLIHEEQQQQWLERKFEGVVLLQSLNIQKELVLNFRKHKEQRNGKVQTVLFDGVFQVLNPAALIAMMEQGVGPAKSFGCGMLSLSPI